MNSGASQLDRPGWHDEPGRIPAAYSRTNTCRWLSIDHDLKGCEARQKAVTIVYFHCGGAASMIRHRVPSSSVCHSEIRILVRGAGGKMAVANCCAHRWHRSAPRERNFPQSMQRDVFIVALSRDSHLPRG